jgi:hypothetical protein
LKTEERKIEFMKLLGKHLGNVQHTCDELGLSRWCYYKWRKSDPDFATQCDIIISSHKSKRQEERPETDMRPEPRAEVTEDDLSLEPQRYMGESAAVIVQQHAAYLRDSMEQSGLYTPAAEPQINAAAKLYASLQIVFSKIDSYEPILTEVSREGNPRLVSNPIHEMIRRQTDTYTNILKALGLNFDSKAKPKEEDSLSTFFSSLDDD